MADQVARAFGDAAAQLGAIESQSTEASEAARR
jgi:hypothetical protein